MRLFSRITTPAAPYFLICLVAATFIGSRVSHFPHVDIMWVLLGGSLIAGIACFIFQSAIRHFFAFLFFSIALFHAVLFFSLPEAPDHIRFLMPKEKVKMTVRIDGFARHFTHQTRYEVQLAQIESRRLGKRKVSGRIMLTIYGRPSLFYFGDVVQFKSYLKPIRNFQNPGGFDYVQHMHRNGIFGKTYARVDTIKRVSEPADKSLYDRVLSTVEKFRNQTNHAILNAKTVSTSAKRILSSLVTGKKENITFQIRDLFSKAGISHILAISGLHLAVIGLFCFPIFYRIFSFSPSFLVSGFAKKAALAATMFPITFYALISGFSASTQRAYIMTIVFIVSFMFEKEKDLFSGLCMAVLVILLMNPQALFSISLQLSFASVFFILFGLHLAMPMIRQINNRPLKKVLSLVMVTFFAGIGTLPLTAHYFHMISLVQLPANLAAVPLIGFFVLPLGILAALINPWFSSAAGLLIDICCRCLSWITALAHQLTQWPMSWHIIPHFGIDAIVLFYLSCVILFFALKRKNTKFCVAVALIVLAILWIGSSIGKTFYLKQTASSKLDITVLDVGQGSSAFIQTPDKKNILIDGGGFSGLSEFDTGRFIVAPFLWHRNVHHLDYVVVTHPETDHLKGLVFIADNFEIDSVVKNRDKNESETYRSFMDICQKKHIKVFYPDKMNRHIRINRIDLDFLGPFETGPDHLNDHSLVTRIEYDNFTMLFPGDILKTREYILSRISPGQLKSDILVAPHHGSATSSSKFFLDQVRPESVIISCGWRNRYGFPHKTVLKRYKKMGIRVLRTDIDGAVQVTTDGRSYRTTTYRGN